MANLKQLSEKPELFSKGHRACLGCGSALAVRQILLATEQPVVCSVATGCLEIFSTIYPYTAWKTPLIHSAFENSAATISGAEAAYRALKRKGEITKDIKFIAFGGDGGTYDIGLQSLSGAIERGHSFLYVCYNNEAYMNTGIQRSSATPLGAHTTTSPAGKKIPGKTQFRKDLTEIVIAHNPPYAAQTTIYFWNDLVTKVQKALSYNGPTFINVHCPCQLGWGYPPEKTVEISKLTADTCVWPVYEYENGNYKLNYKPKEKKPVEDWLKTQGRFRHLFSEKNRFMVEAFQKDVDRKWKELLTKSALGT